MKVTRLSLFLTLSIIFTAFLFSACAGPSGGHVSVDWGDPHATEDTGMPDVSEKQGPPAHAPAHGYRAKYSYRYYPNERTYYDIGRRLYFYMQGAKWEVSVSLPGDIQLSNEYVSITLGTDTPYEQHDEHRRKYPPGHQRKDKKKAHKWASRFVPQASEQPL